MPGSREIEALIILAKAALVVTSFTGGVAIGAKLGEVVHGKPKRERIEEPVTLPELPPDLKGFQELDRLTRWPPVESKVLNQIRRASLSFGIPPYILFGEPFLLAASTLFNLGTEIGTELALINYEER